MATIEPYIHPPHIVQIVMVVFAAVQLHILPVYLYSLVLQFENVKLETALRDSDTAHSPKGASGDLGALRLHAVARKLERAARENRLTCAP